MQMRDKDLKKMVQDLAVVYFFLTQLGLLSQVYLCSSQVK